MNHGANHYIDDEDDDEHDEDDDDDDDDDEEEVGKVQTMCGRRGSWPQDTPPPFLLIHIL